MTLVYLVRHGETAWNRADRWQGHADEPLSDLGRRQAVAAGRRLAVERIREIHTSDLRRARETADIIGAACGLSPRVHVALREIDVGSWAGLTRHEVRERDPEGYARRKAGGKGWDGGESYADLASRVRAHVTALLRESDASARLLLVAHSGVMRILVLDALGLRFSDRERVATCAHGAITLLDVDKGAWSLRVYNDACHLRAEHAVAPRSALSGGA